MSEDQVAADADLDEVEAPTEDHESDQASSPEPAPQCAGCHRRGIGLTLLENGKRYCDRCAHEVERLMGIGPLFVAVPEDTSEDSVDSEVATDALASVEDLLDQTAEAELASATTAVSDEASSDEASSEPSSDQPVAEAVTIEPVTDTEPVAEAPSDEPLGFPVEASAEDESEIAEAVSPPAGESDPIVQPETVPVATVTEPSTADVPPLPVAEEAPEEATSDRDESPPDLTMVIAGANHEAADSASSLLPRPNMTSVNTSEETPLMERVQEQTRPTRVEATASVAPPPADLLGALAAERARLLDQRELLEARFRSETGAIDERLLHVESLLGDQDKPSESLAS